MEIMGIKKIHTVFATCVLGILMSLAFVSSAWAMVTLEEPLVFDETTASISTDGYSWDYSTQVLTINKGGLTITGTETGITLPANSKLILKGDLVIDSVDYALGGFGDLEITGTGDLIISSSYSRTVVVLGDVLFDGIDTNIVGVNGMEIYDGTLTVKDCDMTISATNYALYAENIVEIDGVNLVIDGIFYVDGDELELHDSVITSSSFIGVDELFVDSKTVINGLVSIEEIVGDDYLYTDTVYGDFVVGAGNVFYYGDLNFAKGSTITIPEFVIANWTGYEIDTTNANVIVEGLLIVPEGVDIEGATYANVFEDVSINDWFIKDVLTAYTKGWISGVTETEFAPNDLANRSMFIEILYRMDGSFINTVSYNYEDVNDEVWCNLSVVWADNNGITSGMNDMTFAPNDSITREQVATLLCNYASYLGMDVDADGAMGMAGYADVGEISDWAYSSMTWAVLNGIITGDGDQLNPTDGVTRAELVAILVRFADMQ